MNNSYIDVSEILELDVDDSVREAAYILVGAIMDRTVYSKNEMNIAEAMKNLVSCVDEKEEELHPDLSQVDQPDSYESTCTTPADFGA